MLQTLVIPHLNERCGLSPKEGINCEYVYSREAASVLKVTTNYVRRVPRAKADSVLRAIKEVFQLPDDAKPK